jgi:tryptophan synthase alpha subunit
MERFSTNTNLNKIAKQTQNINAQQRIGLMTHIIVGYPNIDESRRIAELMINKGVDFIELQIPFSDPMADGPTIMKANKVALENRITVRNALDLLKTLVQDHPEFPFLFMTYFNIVHKYGVEKFCQDAANAGCAGLIIPDIPLEEEQQEHYLEFCQKTGLYGIRLLAPISTTERIQLNSKVAQGFMYLSAKQGITGASTDLDPKLIANIERIKNISPLPLAVGFGISEAKHIKALKSHADIAVVGSALIDVYNTSGLTGIDYKLSELIAAIH